MMENYDRTVELMDTAYESAGRGEEQFSKSQDTLQAKLNTLANTWEQFRLKFFNQEFFKDLIDGLNKILDVVSHFDAKKLISIGVIGVTLGKTVITGFIDQIKAGSAGVQTAWNKFINMPLKDRFSREAWKESLAPFSWEGREQKAKNIQQSLSSLGSVNGGGAQADLTGNKELQKKTIELNKQLQIYNQMKIKADALNASEAKGTVQGQEKIAQANQQLEKQIEKVDKLREELGYETEITQENAKQLAQDAGNASDNTKGSGWRKLGGSFLQSGKNALTTGLTVGITAALTSGDVKQAFSMGLQTLITTGISMILPTVIELLLTFLTGPLGIAVIVGAILAGIVMIAKSVDEANQKAKAAEMERLRSVDETNKELQKQQEQILNDLKQAETEKENFSENKERYDYLAQKLDVGVLTDAESEEMKKIAKDFNDNYPDIIRTYDENTGKIEFNSYALQELTKQLEDNEIQQKRELQTVGAQQFSNYNTAIPKIQKLLGEAYGDLRNSTEETVDIEKKVGTINSDGIVLDTKGKPIFELTSDERNTVDNTLGSNMGHFNDVIFDLARALSAETAKSIGIDDDLYSKIINTKSIDEFHNALMDAGVSLSDFSEKVIQGSELQLKTYTEKLEDTSTNYLKTSLYAADIDEKVVDLVAVGSAGKYITQNFSGDGLEKFIEEKKGQYFGSRDVYEGTGGFNEDKDFLKKVKQGEYTINANAQNLSKEDYYALWKSLGYGDGTEDTKTYESLFEETFVNKTKATDYENLSDELKSTLTAIYGTEAADTWNALTAESMADTIEMVLTYQQMLTDGQLENPIGTESYKQIEKGLLQYSNTLNDYGDQIISDWDAGLDKAIDKVGWSNVTNQEDANRIKADVQEKTDEVRQQIQEQVSDLATYSGGLYSEDYIRENFTANTVSLLNAQLGKMKNATDVQRKRVLQIFVEDTQTLTDAQKNILASINFDASYEELLDAKDNYVQSLKETGMDINKASAIYSQLINDASQILSTALLGKEGLLPLKDSVNTFFAGYDEQYSDLFSALEEYYEEGTLKSSTALKLMSGNFADYVKITEDGYTLMADAAEKYYIQMANKPVEMVTKAISDNKNAIKKAREYYKKDTIGLLSASNIESYNRGTFTKEDFNEIATRHFAYSPDTLDGMWNLLVVSAKNGKESVDEYIAAMEENLIEAESYLPQVHLQKLVALSEHYIDTAEKVEDLEEELEDLQGDLDDLNADLDELNNDLAEQNEELIENQKAIDDAYKAWQEAIHGTADFQSSIDGLVNYNNLLSETERNITKIKEGLEEIDSVNQGAQSLQQLKSSTETQLGQLGAQKQVIDNAMANIYGNLIANYGDFTQFDQNGMLAFDFSIENADMPDALKEGYQDLIEQYNDFVTQKQDIQDQEDSINKEYLEMQEQFVDARVTMEQKIIEVLKSQQQEEVDQVKEKYDALKEQDDEYIDALEEAIKKQRDLREQETKYEDLAQKQKKLSLMQRDTSGANQKEVQSLEDEVQKDRQDLLNDEVDNIIDSLKELYEKQTEARELEIQAMEETIEDMSLLNEMAQNIMAGFQNSDDIISWFVGNNAEVDDMTVNQTEQYVNEVKKDSSQFLTAVAAQTEDVTLDAQNVADTSQQVFDSVAQGITDVGDVTQATAEKTAQEAIDNAHKAYDEAVQAMIDTQAKIEETKQKIADTNNSIIETENALAQKDKELSNALVAQQDTMKNTMSEMTRYAKDAMEETAIYATNFIIDAAGDSADFTTAEGTKEFLSKHGLLAIDNTISAGTREALTQHNAVIGDDIKTRQYTLYQVRYNIPNSGGQSQMIGSATSIAEGEQIISDWIGNNNIPRSAFGLTPYKTIAYKKGGLVNYTGPAWVDGTKTAPEAFLSAEDTRRIGEAAQILAQIPALQSASTTSNISTTNVGDTTIEIHLNIDKIANDYDIDQMVNRLKRDIVDISNGVGSSVILKK